MIANLYVFPLVRCLLGKFYYINSVDRLESNKWMVFCNNRLTEISSEVYGYNGRPLSTEKRRDLVGILNFVPEEFKDFYDFLNDVNHINFVDDIEGCGESTDFDIDNNDTGTEGHRNENVKKRKGRRRGRT